MTALFMPMARYQDDDKPYAAVCTQPSFAGALHQAYTPFAQHQAPAYAYSPAFYGNNAQQSPSAHQRYPPAFPPPRQHLPSQPHHTQPYSPAQDLTYSHSSTTPALPTPSASHFQQSPVQQPYPSPASAYIHQGPWSPSAVSVHTPATTVDFQHSQWRQPVVSPHWGASTELETLPTIESRTHSLPIYQRPEVPSQPSWDVPARSHEIPGLIAAQDAWSQSDIGGAAHTLITPPGSASTLTKVESPTHNAALPLSSTATLANQESSYAGPQRMPRRGTAPRSKRESTAGPSCWKGRTGPLSQTTREKSVSLREFGACWRCKKYRKPCTGGPGMCETCSTSGFRVWPSEIGCRRGNFDTFVDLILPPSAETTLKNCSVGFSKRQQWRRLLGPQTLQAAEDASAFATEDVRWRALLYKVLGTRIFGQEFVELFEIVANFQQSACKEHPSLDAACTMLASTCDFYNTFIEVGGLPSQATSVQNATTDLPHVLRTIRKSFSRALRLVLAGCLSGRAAEWLPSLLTCVVMCCAVVMLADVAFAIPAELRRLIWPDITEMYAEVKSNLYTTVCHLLNALAKGSKPLKMACWRFEPCTESSSGGVSGGTGTGTGSGTGFKRNEQGMQLVGRDEACFDGVRALQDWLGRHEGVVRNVGRTWTGSRPFSMATVPTICVAGALFEC